MADPIIHQRLLDPMEWHDGNIKMHKLMAAPTQENPTSPNLSRFQAGFLQICNIFAISTTDEHDQPWTSLWGGEDGAVSVYNLRTIAIKSLIKPNDGVCGNGQPISGLGLRLATRDRVKLSGKVMGALLEKAEGEDIANASVVIEVETSLGNCPKYLNIKELRPAVPDPIIHPRSLPLPEPALELIRKADCFFISAGCSTNYRGGPHGFVRVFSNKPDSIQLVYPEYSGNRLYQTLGNLFVKPLAGVVIPDFETGDALYATCEARIVAGPEASSLMPRTNLVVILTVKDARFVQRALPFRAIEGDPSPYNPPLRLLKEEGSSGVSLGKPLAQADLVDRVMLSDSIALLRFATDQPITYKIGQHVALNFETDLGMGYSHMREDDPTSLNDDLNRSFTITSTATSDTTTNNFELVIRNVGRVTKHLVKYNIRGGISCAVLGFGGSFAVEHGQHQKVGFLAGGVGITPLFCQADIINPERLHLIWTINQKDIPFAVVATERWPLLKSAQLFVSGAISQNHESQLDVLESQGVRLNKRRLQKTDFEDASISKWYVCTGPALQKSATGWLEGKEIVSESFSF